MTEDYIVDWLFPLKVENNYFDTLKNALEVFRKHFEYFKIDFIEYHKLQEPVAGFWKIENFEELYKKLLQDSPELKNTKIKNFCSTQIYGKTKILTPTGEKWEENIIKIICILTYDHQSVKTLKPEILFLIGICTCNFFETPDIAKANCLKFNKSLEEFIKEIETKLSSEFYSETARWDEYPDFVTNSGFNIEAIKKIDFTHFKRWIAEDKEDFQEFKEFLKKKGVKI